MRLLVIRTSAMGDVALTTPLIKAIREQFPDVELMLLTKPEFVPFFSSIKGLLLFTTDYGNRHKGIRGLIRLFKDIVLKGKVDYVIDLHDVLRSKILRILFSIKGVPVSVLDKGRSEKKALIKGKRKVQLKHAVERYRDTFARAGFQVEPVKGPWIIPSSDAIIKTVDMMGNFNGLNIGVAPYAKHELKVWPEENMIQLLKLISERRKSRYWLFGGNDEAERLSFLEDKITCSINIAGKIKLDEELALISKLDFMIAMDSSNMHMAALAGTRVVSIWGGTDPMNGFGAWMQPGIFSVKIPVDELVCRPCTIYGKGNCRRGDIACMNWLTPGMVFQKLIMTGLLE